MSVLDSLKGDESGRMEHEIITHQPLFAADGRSMADMILVTRTAIVSEPREGGGRQITTVLGTESMIVPSPGVIPE